MNLYFNGNQEPQVVNKEEFITFLYEIANKFDSLNSVSITIKTKDMILLESAMNEQVNIDESDPQYGKLKEKLSKIKMK